jgi:hypothetical protein
VLCEWIYNEDLESLPLQGNYSLQHAQTQGGDCTIQYAILSKGSCLFVVFRGTADVVDLCTDVGAVPKKDEAMGLKVHGGMYLSLENDAVLPQVLQHVADWVAQDHQAALVCVCGHSLGAGYAVLTTAGILPLIHATHEHLKVRAVTFGQPQVFAPLSSSSLLEDNALWQTLHRATVNVVNRHDMVARLPSTGAWMYGPNAVITSDIVPGWFGTAARHVLGSRRPNCFGLEAILYIVVEVIAILIVHIGLWSKMLRE